MRFLTMHPYALLIIVAFGLSLPAAFGVTTLKRYSGALAASAFGVVLPLVVFCFSAFLVPEWKGGCEHGWLDCFHLGKLALTPLVLWATASLYAVEVCRLRPPFNRAVTLGLWSGAVIAGVCFVFGIVVLRQRLSTMSLLLLVPLYVAVWHGLRASQAMAHSRPSASAAVWTGVGSLPFWLGSWFWSWNVYDSLPDQPPSCFVVTAASRGHRGIVGPRFPVASGTGVRMANRQLQILWQFESLWNSRAPRSHAGFRRIYNRVGPAIASRITAPWLADLVFLALKPVELLAAIVLQVAVVTQDHRGKMDSRKQSSSPQIS
jgi:hypothetical protein